LVRTLRYARYRLSERYHERRFGIETGGVIPLAQFGLDAPERREYTPLPYRYLFDALAKVPCGPEDVFLDYGCGKGRALVAAASRGFGEVIGVELAPELCAAAEANVKRAARRLRCSNVRLVKRDYAEFRGQEP